MRSRLAPAIFAGGVAIAAGILWLALSRGEGRDAFLDHRRQVLEAPPTGRAFAGSTLDGTPFIVVRHPGGDVTAVPALSPHVVSGRIRKLMGWCPSSRTFDDPFHGAKFDEYGRYLLGPAASGMVRFGLETVSETPLSFRLGEAMTPLPTTAGGEPPAGPFCAGRTTLVLPDVADSGLSPAALAASAPPRGSRWSLDAALYVTPDGSSLCARIVRERCRGGVEVVGPVSDGAETLVVQGTWFVLVEGGILADPIRAG